MRLAPTFLLLLALIAPERSAWPASPQEKGRGLVGKLLVADADLADPNFDHTVVLMIEDDADGTVGLVLNRPYGKAPTAELLQRLGVPAANAQGETTLFYGGPVQPEIGMVVHSAEYSRTGTQRVTDAIAVTGDPRILEDVAAGKGPRQSIPVLGYAGWSPGQLERELAEHSWFTLPADPALVFAADPAKAWEAAYARRGVDL